MFFLETLRMLWSSPLATWHYYSLERSTGILGTKIQTHPPIDEDKMCAQVIEIQIHANDKGTLSQKKCSKLLAGYLLKHK